MRCRRRLGGPGRWGGGCGHRPGSGHRGPGEARRRQASPPGSARRRLRGAGGGPSRAPGRRRGAGAPGGRRCLVHRRGRRNGNHSHARPRHRNGRPSRLGSAPDGPGPNHCARARLGSSCVPPAAGHRLFPRTGCYPGHLRRAEPVLESSDPPAPAVWAAPAPSWTAAGPPRSGPPSGPSEGRRTAPAGQNHHRPVGAAHCPSPSTAGPPGYRPVVPAAPRLGKNRRGSRPRTRPDRNGRAQRPGARPGRREHQARRSGRPKSSLSPGPGRHHPDAHCYPNGRRPRRWPAPGSRLDRDASSKPLRTGLELRPVPEEPARSRSTHGGRGLADLGAPLRPDPENDRPAPAWRLPGARRSRDAPLPDGAGAPARFLSPPARPPRGSPDRPLPEAISASITTTTPRLRTRTRKGPCRRHGTDLLNNYSGDVLLSQGDTPQVPSALAGLTSVFGMGTGVAPPLWPPETLLYLGVALAGYLSLSVP